MNVATASSDQHQGPSRGAWDDRNTPPLSKFNPQKSVSLQSCVSQCFIVHGALGLAWRWQRKVPPHQRFVVVATT